MRFIRPILLTLIFLLTLSLLGNTSTAHAAGDAPLFNTQLADSWPWEIQRWSPQIETVSLRYGIDPNLIASIMLAESAGNDQLVSYAGAVGLMGVMPQGPGFMYRPTAEELFDPNTNLNMGAAILADILRQSGGDIHAALAAYNGGWDLVDHPVPRGYAAKVLNFYGQSIASRAGMSTDFATRWTIGVEIRGGHIPTESLLLGDNTVAVLNKYGEHLIYRGVDANGRTYFIKGYAVPVVYAPTPEKYNRITPN
jgi:hypothetical protein